MKPIRKILTDPAFWSLIVMNGVLINYCRQHPGGFKTYIWIYWLQSVLIGIFNFFNILSIHNVIPGSMKLNDQPVTNSNGTGCISFFFLVHFEFFHLAYAIFLGIKFHGIGPFDWTLFKYAFFAVLINQIIWFIQQKMRYNRQPANIGKIFFLPYLRILPMHLCILIPAFFHLGSMMVFLLLKTLMDIIMHLVTTGWYWTDKREMIGDIAKTDLI